MSFCSIWEIISIIDKDSMDYFFIVDIIWIKFTWYWYCPITTPPRMDNIWDQLSLQLDGSARTLFLRSCVSYFTYTYWVEKEAVFRGNILSLLSRSSKIEKVYIGIFQLWNSCQPSYLKWEKKFRKFHYLIEPLCRKKVLRNVRYLSWVYSVSNYAKFSKKIFLSLWYAHTC